MQKALEKKYKNIVHVSFMDLEKIYDRVTREALCKYCECMMWVILLIGIKSIYVTSLTCVE